MATIPGFDKSDDEVLDYAVDWSAWLGVDTIATSTWSVASGLTVNSESETTTLATVWLSGGTNNTIYLVTNKIVTVGGRTAERSFNITLGVR